jgi:hypothetical protein
MITDKKKTSMNDNDNECGDDDRSKIKELNVVTNSREVM